MAKKKFQPTPPHRGRRHGQRDQRNGAGISTHAPAQGATCRGANHQHFRKYFNPRPRTGGDRLWYVPDLEVSYFNPRPRTGGDNCLAFVYQNIPVISTHAPAQGATFH